MKDIKIFQGVFEKNKNKSSDDLSYIYIENKYPDFRELQIYIKIYHENLWKDQRYTGVISDKFKLKTHLSPFDFMKFISKNIDENYNLFFINPFPQYRYWYFNVWEQGEIMHPGLIAASQDLLSNVGINMQINKNIRHNENNLCFCNYWVGDQEFWQSYVGKILLPIYEYMVSHDFKFSSSAILNKTSHTTSATLFPFFIERLFSTYIANKINIKVMPFKFNKKEILEKYCLNEFEVKLLNNIHDEIEIADFEDSYDSKLIAKMKFLAGLHKLHFDSYYKNNIHPHLAFVKS